MDNYDNNIIIDEKTNDYEKEKKLAQEERIIAHERYKEQKTFEKNMMNMMNKIKMCKIVDK